jgi:hypothetical protein
MDSFEWQKHYDEPTDAQASTNAAPRLPPKPTITKCKGMAPTERDQTEKPKKNGTEKPKKNGTERPKKNGSEKPKKNGTGKPKNQSY